MKEKDIRELFSCLNVNENTERREIYNRLNDKHGIGIKPENSKPSFYITGNFDKNLYQIEVFVRLVERTKRLPYSITRTSSNGISIKPDKTLSLGIRNIKYFVLHHQTNLVYSPHVELFYQTLLSSSYPYEVSDWSPDTLYVDTKTLAELANDFVIALRNGTGASEFKKRINDQRENSYRQFRSAIRYVNSLFIRYSSLVYVRIDLHLRSEAVPDDESTLNTMLNHFARFRKLISRKQHAFKYMVGYIAHIEYGEEKGHHIHVSYFYHKKDSSSGYNLSQEIGHAWEKITLGDGHWYSTNRLWRTPVCNALGTIRRTDMEKRTCLYYAIGYTVKSDQYLTFKYKRDQKLFFQGTIPKLKSKDKGTSRLSLKETNETTIKRTPE